MPDLNVAEIKKCHPQWLQHSNEWALIKTCLLGEPAVKETGSELLPFPVPLDSKARKTDKFKQQYQVYLENAHFVNYTEQAVEDLLAGCFRKDVVFEVAPEVEYIDIDTHARNTVHAVTSYGRAFLLADYPAVETQPKLIDEKEKGIAAYIAFHDAIQVINWESSVSNGMEVPTRAVIADVDAKGNYWKELCIVDNKYTVRIHRENSDGSIEQSEYIVKVNGKTISYIPGIFVGSVSNSVKVDRIPVLGIARSNIKHYQTWAELMHVQTYCGHPQVVVSGLPTGWLNALEQQMKEAAENGETQSAPLFNFGASQVLTLEGENSTADVLKLADSNLIHFKTLEQLEKSMLEQGARIKAFNIKSGVESNAALITRSSGESSQLAKIATNVESALEFVVDQCSLFMGGADKQSSIEINKEFFEPVVDPALVTILNTTIGAGNLPRTVLWDYLRSVNIIKDDIDDETLEANLEQVASGISRAAFNQNP